MRRRIHPTTILVLVAILLATGVAAFVTRSVRDTNEARLLKQRADGVGQIVAGLGSGYEADLVAAAAVAGMGTQDDLAEHVRSSRDEMDEAGTWALVERSPDGDRAIWVEPVGASTYFDGGGGDVPAFDRQLDRAFAGDFVVAGLFGEGMDRRLGVAKGVRGAPDRIVYLEFPLLAVAAADSGDEADLFADIVVGLYVGGEPSPDSLIFATYEGDVPEGASVVEFPFGGQGVSVVVKARAPLGGALADALPWIVLGFGLSVAALAALLVEVSRRRQAAAVAVAAELTAKNRELDLAISEQARAEADLVEAQRREAIGQLAGGVAHDFNNLLAVIVAYAGLVQDAIDDEAVRADVEEISAAAERGAALTRQLLLFARNDTPTGESAPIDEVLTDMGRLLERTVSDDVRLVLDLGAPSTAVHVSTTALEQIAVNLVVNARDALTSGGEIKVRTWMDPLGERVVLEVADDGCGMPAEVAARAFEPFFSTKDRASGTGLGLATVRSIVDGAGGRVDISSIPDVGTTVRIELPASAAEVATVTAAAPPAPGESARILLVEDEEVVRRAMRRMLERNGHRVYEASSAVDAVQRYLDSSEPHLLLTDAVMPGGMSGKDLAERFRTRHPGLPVVYVSGYSFDLLASRGIEEDAGPLRVLAKPFTEAQLTAAVTEALGDLAPA